MQVAAEASHLASALREARGRRRLSQLEVALRAGTSQRYVSFVERGLSLPGRSMVVRLAESLELPLRERNDLLLAAGYAPLYADTELDDPTLRPILGALQHVLDGHQPYPAIVLSRVGEVIAANHAFAVLTEAVAPWLLRPPINVYRVLLHPEGLAPHIRNFGQWGRHVLLGLRRSALRDPDPRLEELLHELERQVPVGRESGPDQLGFAVPLQLDSPRGPLRLISAITSLATATEVAISELKLEAFLPADEATAITLGERR